MKTIRWSLAILSCILMFNCASNVKAKSYNDENLYNYSSYAYLPDTQMNISDFNRELEPSIDEAAISKMKEEMNERGFTNNSGSPDLVVLISSSNAINSNQKKDGSNRSTPESSSSSNSPYSGSSGSTTTQKYTGKNSATINRPYQTGNMAIEVFNSNTKELVWSGVAKDFKTDIAGQNLSVRMVDEIFNKFPKSGK